MIFKSFIFIFTFVFSTLVFSQEKGLTEKDFKIIVTSEKEFMMKKKSFELKLQKMHVTGSSANILKVETYDDIDDITLVIYKAGESGTSAIIQEQRAALFSKSNDRFIGDALYHYKTKGQEKEDHVQPIWKIKDGYLKVYTGGILSDSVKIPK